MYETESTEGSRNGEGLKRLNGLVLCEMVRICSSRYRSHCEGYRVNRNSEEVSDGIDRFIYNIAFHKIEYGVETILGNLFGSIHRLVELKL